MILYKGSAFEFSHDVQYNKISDILEAEFIRVLGRKVNDSEGKSFRNSLSKMNEVLLNEKLVKKDCGVLIEYQLPGSSMRLDFMITGKDKFDNRNAVIVELKQWDKVEEANTERQIHTYTGGNYRDVNHPAVQVSNYKSYLEDYHSAFHKEAVNTIKLFACSYLHNYKAKADDKLLDLKFKVYMDECPVYTADDVRNIGQFIRTNVEKGDGLELVDYIEKSIAKPSVKLIEHVNNIIDSKSEFILMDEQLVVFDRVMQIVKDNQLDGTDGKFVVLVKGGPGTGKSVVGLNLLSKILSEDKESIYLAANAAFKNGMANKLDKHRAKVLFKHPYFYNKDLTLSNQEFQTAIIDEAHRISSTPPPMQMKLDNSLVEEIIKKTHLSVFFTDDNQMIRPNDIGSYSHVKSIAKQYNCKLYEYELDAQFRCAGSEGYLNWIDDVLGIRETANASGWENLDDLEFHIVDDPNVMKDRINKLQALGYTSRIVAGYAWPWSKELDDEGNLYNDVQIFKQETMIFEMPWNPQESYKGKRGKGIPRSAAEWSIDPSGVNQIGCIHTCQGLEFDYVGIIIGEEFKYSLENETWEADTDKCFDAKIGKNSQDQFLRLARNTYKTLLSRGIKGVYVYAVDEDTRTYLKRRLKVVQDIDDQRFYHTKRVDIRKVFSVENKGVAETKENYGDSRTVVLNQYSISPFVEDYYFCDVHEERILFNELSEMNTVINKDEENDLYQLLEDTPQIRYYSGVDEVVKVNLGIIKIKPLVVVSRVVEGKKRVSLVFR